jgi:plastocyanin
MKKLVAALAAACLAGIALFAIPALAATKTVTVKDVFYSPRSLTVGKGTTVKWVWRGKLRHEVFVTRGPAKFHSPLKAKGTYSRRLTRKGTYTIVCRIHPGMGMTIKVR